MLKLTRGVSSLAVGAISGGLIKSGSTTQFGQNISYSAISEGVLAVGGLALQMWMPNTMPEVVDGVVDGALALLGRRGTAHLMGATAFGQYNAPPYLIPPINQPALMPPPTTFGGYMPQSAMAYPQLGTTRGTSKNTIY